MRISVQLPLTEPVTVAARLIEDAGLDAVSVADVLIGDGSPGREAVVSLAAAAAVTERVHLDFGVLSVPTRPLPMLAAQVRTLQEVSGGRVRLGLGIGGFAGSPFWRALGAPETGRGAQLDAALQLLPRLIAGDPGPEGVVLAPAAPVPPMLVGGGSAEVVLRRVARLADGWLPSALTPAQVATSVARLREFAAEYGRPTPMVLVGAHALLGDGAAADELAGELAGFFGLTPEDAGQVVLSGQPGRAAERIAAYADAGADELGLALHGDFRQQLGLLARARGV